MHIGKCGTGASSFPDHAEGAIGFQHHCFDIFHGSDAFTAQGSSELAFRHPLLFQCVLLYLPLEEEQPWLGLNQTLHGYQTNG